MLLRRRKPRRAVTLIELALVAPALIILVLGLVISSFGVFRYQEMAWLAREGARYASLHGAQYQSTTGLPAATADDVFTSAIKPRMAGLDPNQFTYTVTWNPDNQQGSTVTVTVRYKWIPEALFTGVTLSSTSTMTVVY